MQKLLRRVCTDKNNTAHLHKTVSKIVIVVLCALCNKSYLMEERIFILKHYFAVKLDECVRDALKRVFPDKVPPANSTIFQLLVKFHATGSCANLPKQRNQTIITHENRACVAANVVENPRLSTWKRALALAPLAGIHPAYAA